MKITRVKVFPSSRSNNNTVAYATITLDEELVVSGIRILNGGKGYFIGMPSRKKTDPETNKSEWRDIVFPCSKESRSKIEKAVLDEFDKVKDEAGFVA